VDDFIFFVKRKGCGGWLYM